MLCVTGGVPPPPQHVWGPSCCCPALPCPPQGIGAPSCPHLTSLTVSNNRAFPLGLSVLPECTALRRLGLWAVKVASLEPLARCPSLEFISLCFIAFEGAEEPAGGGIGHIMRSIMGRGSSTPAPCRSLLRDILRAGPERLPALREVQLRGLAVAADAASQPLNRPAPASAAAAGSAGTAAAAAAVAAAGVGAPATCYVRVHELVSLLVRWPRLCSLHLCDATGLTARITSCLRRRSRGHQEVHINQKVCGAPVEDSRRGWGGTQSPMGENAGCCIGTSLN